MEVETVLSNNGRHQYDGLLFFYINIVWVCMYMCRVGGITHVSAMDVLYLQGYYDFFLGGGGLFVRFFMF